MLRCLIILTSFAISTTAFAEQRLALVIGNNNYLQAHANGVQIEPLKSLGPLKNPLNDVDSMVDLLNKYDFEVNSLKNANYEEMKVALEKFYELLDEKGGTGLFYYSGHGVQINNINYLIPIDREFHNLQEIVQESINVDSVMEEMGTAGKDSQGKRVNIIILDTCRAVIPTDTGIERGLAPLQKEKVKTRGIVIGYATEAGSTAGDGDNLNNGVYTYYLLNAVKANNTSDIEMVLKKTRIAVAEATKGEQIPYIYSGLTDVFCFSDCRKPVNADVQVKELEEEDKRIMQLTAEASTALVDNAVLLAKTAGWNYARASLHKKALAELKHINTSDKAQKIAKVQKNYEELLQTYEKRFVEYLQTTEKLSNYSNRFVATAINSARKRNINDPIILEILQCLDKHVKITVSTGINAETWKRDIQQLALKKGLFLKN